MEEEQQRNDKQKQINIIGLMKVPDQFRKMFDQLKKIAGERLQMHEFEAAIEYYLKCIDMMDLGKHLLSSSSPFNRACLYASLAAAYQGAWKIQKCNKFCEKSEEELQKLITDDNKEQYLKVSKFLVTLKFQHCAILSQLNMHQKALETCKSTLPILQKAISIINTLAKKQEESFNSKCSDQGVIFSRKVYGFAGQILSNITNQITDNIDVKQSKSSSFYFWQRNPQKNEEQLKKIFLPQNNNNSKRSILGVNKQNHWVDQFNIGSIMRMGELKLQSLQKNIPIQEYLFKDKLYEIVIHCSLAFFTIATEMRFIDSEKDRQIQEMKSEKQLSRLETIKKKYGYQQKSETFKLSEAYHLRAIQIISSNIQAPIPYLTHMIKSYDKHYIFKKKLEEIVAIIDESVLEPSSIINPNATKMQSNIYTKNNEYSEHTYGEELAAINRQTTEEGQLYNDYEDNLHQKNKKGEEKDFHPNSKRQQKIGRNTAKLFFSNPHDDLNTRAKSLGKTRRNGQKANGNTKNDKTQKQNTQANPKMKKKKDKQAQKELCKQKQQKIRKTRIRLTEYNGEGQLHVRTKSSTHIKFVFKKKK